MRIFKTKSFARFQSRERISDAKLAEAVHIVENGLIDADLGGGLIKVRIARTGAGKSGGYRTIVAYKRRERSVFLFGFAKNERANISQAELAALRKLGRGFLELTVQQLGATIGDGDLLELNYEP